LNEQNDEQETNTTSNTDSKQSSSSESPEPSVELNSSNENENSIEIASSEITTEYDQNCVSSLVLLEENRHLYTIKELYGGRQNSSYQCMLRFLFVPSNFDDLIYSDVNSFNYLYEQVKRS